MSFTYDIVCFTEWRADEGGNQNGKLGRRLRPLSPQFLLLSPVSRGGATIGVSNSVTVR